MAIQSQPSRISEPFAGSGTKNVIPATNTTPSASQAASWASGFPPECSQPISAGGCPVPRDDMNGVLNQLSQDFSFRQDGGVWEWSALADYDASRAVRGSDGNLYWSIAQSGPNAGGAQDPTTDNGTYWQQVPVDNADVVHKSGDETISGAKKFLKAPSVENTFPMFFLNRTDSSNRSEFNFQLNGVRLGTIVYDENGDIFISAKPDENSTFDNQLKIGYDSLTWKGYNINTSNTPGVKIVSYTYNTSTTITGDGQTKITFTPAAISGYTPSMVIGGHGNGGLGWLAQTWSSASEAWIINTRPTSITLASITVYILYTRN